VGSDDTSKVPNAPGWWLRGGIPHHVYRSGEALWTSTVQFGMGNVHLPVSETEPEDWGGRLYTEADVSGIEDAAHAEGYNDARAELELAPIDFGTPRRLYTEAEHTEAVRLAEERGEARLLERARADVAAADRLEPVAELAMCNGRLAASRDTAAALRAELEAERHNRDLAQDGWARCQAELEVMTNRIAELEVAKTQVLTVGYDAYAEPHLDPYGEDPSCHCAKCSVFRVESLRADLAAARARIAELEGKLKVAEGRMGDAGELVARANWDADHYRSELARMKAERDKAWRTNIEWQVARNYNPFTPQGPEKREIAIARHGTKWADEHFPEGT
jgi:hypothetical protein